MILLFVVEKLIKVCFDYLIVVCMELVCELMEWFGLKWVEIVLIDLGVDGFLVGVVEVGVVELECWLK